jgi:hypothetical protein
MKKALIFDSSAIISLALNDLLYILEPLKKYFDGDFYITQEIKSEIIDYSVTTKRFMLEALMVNNLVEKGILKVYPGKLNVEKFLRIANETYKTNDSFINILHRGEASCLALFDIIDVKKKAIVVDERTTRMLCESPEQLRQLLEKKLDKKLKASTNNYSFFNQVNILRSSELAYLALKKGIIKLSEDKSKVLEALLYALKFKGCAISIKEIESLVH